MFWDSPCAFRSSTDDNPNDAEQYRRVKHSLVNFQLLDVVIVESTPGKFPQFDAVVGSVTWDLF